MQAIGIHVDPDRKLGRRPTDQNRKILRMRWVNGVVPSYPPEADHFTGWSIGLLSNSKYGDCGPVSVENHRRMTTKLLTGTEDQSTQADVFDLYRRSGNPTFNPDTGQGDNGVDMSVLMSAAMSGGISGDKLIGYARLPDRSDASVYAAITIFGGVLFGVDLQAAQQSQTNAGLWDYKQSGDWGGHAVMAASFNVGTGRVDVATWGKRCGSTSAFRQHQLSEVWVPLWKELVSSQKFFHSGVDLQSLARDYQALTGRVFPVVVPPVPVPVPVPVPPGPPPLPPEPPPATGPTLAQYTAVAHQTLEAVCQRNPRYAQALRKYQGFVDAAELKAFGVSVGDDLEIVD